MGDHEKPMPVSPQKKTLLVTKQTSVHASMMGGSKNGKSSATLKTPLKKSNSVGPPFNLGTPT